MPMAERYRTEKVYDGDPATIAPQCAMDEAR
jgi:hypothetical protein